MAARAAMLQNGCNGQRLAFELLMEATGRVKNWLRHKPKLSKRRSRHIVSSC